MKTLLGIFVMIASGFLGHVSAKCINQTHAKMRTFKIFGKDEETKEYKCFVMQRVNAAFNSNKECTYCECHQDFHDNEERRFDNNTE